MESIGVGVVLAVWGGLASLLWCVFSLQGWRMARRISRLVDQPLDEEQRWPRLSVIVPACNEADTLEDALTTLLAQSYPELEIILVDDRSTDGTGAIIDRMARADPRIVPVHITVLPPAWLGKVHALDVATQRATGEWLLFTDADVHFAPGALRRAVSVALSGGLDHLTLLPDIVSGGFMEDIVVSAFGAALLRQVHADDISRPDSDAAAGIGAFNLVRRVALERSPGFDWLRMEVTDDLGLGLLLKRAGARSALMVGSGVVSVLWYPSLGAIIRGLEKNAFAVTCRFSWARLVASVVLIWTLVPGPLVVLAQRQVPWLWPLGALALATHAAWSILVWRRFHRPLAPTLLGPLGSLLITAILINSAVACTRRGGIVWRGTTYPLAALRAGQRVKL